jgi:hypothetical protein
MEGADLTKIFKAKHDPERHDKIRMIPKNLKILARSVP